MADKKISQLTPSALPLAGTEVLPIVQSGATVKVASDDLTVKNVRSNATTGILQVAGPAAGATRTMTTPDANFTAARIDAAQSFTGDQTLATGNLVIGTAGKGIDFSADSSAAGMTSELLNDYEEGTFTPTIIGSSSAGVGTYAFQIGRYTKVGRLVTFNLSIQWTAHTGVGNTIIDGLPFVAANVSNHLIPQSIWQVGGPVTGADIIRIASIFPNNARIDLRETNLTTMGVGNSNAITATGTFYISGSYYV